ncbi:MAG TPA: redoxin family protein [Alphaproteobacteria bacterium]
MMKFIRMLPFILFTILALLFGVALVNGQSANRSALTNEKIPSFSLRSFSRPNALFQSSEMQKPSLLVFWASWCGICKTELPALSQFAQKNNIPLYGIAYRDNHQALLTTMYQMQHQVKFTDMGLDQTGEVGAKYGLTGVPTTIVIARDGSIARVKSGAMTERELKNEILPVMR